MIRKHRLVFTLPLSLAALTLVMLVQGVAAARPNDGFPGDQPAGNGKTLEGTWRVEITPRNCLTGDAVPNPFPALASFARGGTVTTSDGGSSPAARGAGLGAWWHAQGGGFAAVTEAFLFTAGVRTGLQRITQSIELTADGEEFNANVISEIEDTVGHVVARGCATSVGSRL